jgi:hypothetical protein
MFCILHECKEGKSARNQLAQQDDDAGYLQGITKEVQGVMVPVSAASHLDSGWCPLYKSITQNSHKADNFVLLVKGGNRDNHKPEGHMIDQSNICQPTEKQICHSHIAFLC